MCKYYTVTVITIHSYHKLKINMDDRLVKVFVLLVYGNFLQDPPTPTGISNGPFLYRYRYNIINVMNEWD